jgi:hypothetical protein
MNNRLSFIKSKIVEEKEVENKKENNREYHIKLLFNNGNETSLDERMVKIETGYSFDEARMWLTFAHGNFLLPPIVYCAFIKNNIETYKYQISISQYNNTSYTFNINPNREDFFVLLDFINNFIQNK